MIVSFLELGHGDAYLVDVAEDAAVDGLLLQRPVETFGDAVGLRFGDQGEARRAPQNLTWLRKSLAVYWVP